MARVQSTIAVQASAAARSTAAGIAEPANTAIVLTAPFAGKDVDADFAAAVAAAAEQMGAEQVASAEAKAAEAVKAAEAAEAAAKRANAQVAPAFKAAADAARSAANAARSAAAAMKSAAQAAEEGAKARAAAARANQADAQAQADAQLARQAANQAFADATAARNAANQAEAEASRARGAAAEADNHAVAANSAATRAESEASVARGAAAQAEKDAADAGKFAESAEGHAKSAEAAAKNANTYAREADESAKRAEEYQREQERKAREAAAKEAEKYGNAPELQKDELQALKDAGISPEAYEAARQLAEKGVLDFLLENGGEIIVDLLFEDIKKCFSEGNFESCFWAVVGALPWGKALKIIKEMPKIAKALTRIVGGLNDFLDKNAAAKKLVKQGEEILEKAGAACEIVTKPLGGPAARSVSKATTARAQSVEPPKKWCGKVSQHPEVKQTLQDALDMLGANKNKPGNLGKLGSDDNPIQLWQRQDGSLADKFKTPEQIANVKKYFTREELQVLKKYFDKVDEVSTHREGGTPSPSAQQRSAALQCYLDNW